MAAGRPFVSVVVPTRNRPEFLRYCLESLTLQTFNESALTENVTRWPGAWLRRKK